MCGCTNINTGNYSTRLFDQHTTVVNKEKIMSDEIYVIITRRTGDCYSNCLQTPACFARSPLRPARRELFSILFHKH